MRNVRGQIAYNLVQCCAILVLSFDVVGTATGQDAFVSADLDLHKLDMRDEISHKDAILALEKIVEGDFSSISQFFLKSRFASPSNYRIWNDLAILFARSGNLLEAKYNFEKSLAIVKSKRLEAMQQGNVESIEILENVISIVQNSYDDMKKKLVSSKLSLKCDKYVDRLEYVQAVRCLQSIYRMKDLFKDDNFKSRFELRILHRLKFVYFNTGRSEETLDICKEIRTIIGNDTPCDDDQFFVVTLKLHACFTKYIKNGGAVPLLKHTNNPCDVFSVENVKLEGGKTHPFFKCIMLASQFSLVHAIKCGESILNQRRATHAVPWDPFLMPVSDIVHLWHVRQSLGLLPILESTKTSFFHRGRVFVLNRETRKYRRYQAQKALSRLDLGLELTFLDAIDKDDIRSYIAKYEGNISYGLGETLARHNLLQNFKISMEELKVLKPTLGEIACAMSHVSIWKKVVDSRLPFAIVFEDDAIIKGDLERYERDIGRFISREINFLGTNLDLPEALKRWDFIHLGACKRVKLTQFILPPFLSQSGFQFCTHAYVVSALGAQKLIKLSSEHNVVPIDEFLTWAWGKPHIKRAKEMPDIPMYRNDNLLRKQERLNAFVLGARLLPFSQFNVHYGSPHGKTSDVTPAHNLEMEGKPL